MNRARYWLAAGAAVGLLVVGAASDAPRPTVSDAARARVLAKASAGPPPPFSFPAGAAEHHRLRRLPLAPGDDPGAALEAARRALAAMPVYSTRAGSFLPPGAAPRRTWLGAAGALDTWEPLGPGNIGGRTRALVIHPRKPRILWAAGVSGGIWKSTNGGRRWRPVGDALSNLAVNTLALDPRDPRVLYAGTGEGYFREVVRGTGLPLRGGGIFKSVDGGETWERLESTRGKRFFWVNDIVVSRHSSERLYAATRRGVFRSLDGGGSWARVLTPRVKGGCLQLEETPDEGGDALLASCGTLRPATVWRNPAAEGPGRWRAVLAEPGMARVSLAAAPSDPDVVYALAASQVPGPGGRFEQALHAVFRSDDGGATWEARLRNTDPRKINTVILHNPVIAFLEECGFQGLNEYFAMGWYVNVIAVDPRDADRVWAGGVDLFRSDDGGRNWNPVTYWWTDNFRPSFVHADHHGLVFHPRKPQILYSLNDGGIYRTTNAAARVSDDPRAVCVPGASAVAWQSLNNEYGVTQFYHGLPYPGDPDTFQGGTQDNGTLLGHAEFRGQWQRVFGGDGGYSAVDPRDRLVSYLTIQNGLVFKSTIAGVEEAVVGIDDLVGDSDTDDFTATRRHFLFISPLVMDPNDPDRLWLGGTRLWRTDDGAGLWNEASRRLPGGAKVSALAVVDGDSDRVLAGCHTGWIFRTARGTTADAGTAWESSRPRRGFVTSVAFDPGDPTVAYATYGGFGGRHVWRSEDGGATWRSIDGQGATRVPDVPVHSIAIDPLDSRRLYLGTDLGVFVSLDRGTTWAVENTGFAAAVTEHLEVSTGGAARYLFAFTHGRGAWRVPLE